MKDKLVGPWIVPQTDFSGMNQLIAQSVLKWDRTGITKGEAFKIVVHSFREVYGTLFANIEVTYNDNSVKLARVFIC